MAKTMENALNQKRRILSNNRLSVDPTFLSFDPTLLSFEYNFQSIVHLTCTFDDVKYLLQ